MKKYGDSSEADNRQSIQNQITKKYEINLYNTPPQHNISIDYFKKACISRVKLLRQIESLFEVYSEDSGEQRMSELNQKIINFANTLDIEKNKELDEVSFFLTSLAYCKTENLQRWFIQQECRLLNARIETYKNKNYLQNTDLKLLLEQFNVQIELIQKNEWDSQKENIINGQHIRQQINEITKKKTPKQAFQISDFIKVPFTDALDLVSKLKVFMKSGFLYVPLRLLSTVVIKHFKSKKLAQMEKVRTHLSEIVEADERIGPLLNVLSDMYFGDDFAKAVTSSKTGLIKLADLDVLSKRSFPPCMRYMNDCLKANHHLKHIGRLQFGLFLKGCGLTLEDSMKFWKGEFTKIMTAEKFERNYAYNIQHNYGKQGKRIDYTPKSCMGILKDSPPGNDEHHGCPFRHFSDSHLTTLLKKMGIDVNSKDYKTIIEKKQQNHFQIACIKTFQALHKDGIADNVGQHPNSYFESSMKFYGSSDQKTNAAPKQQQQQQAQDNIQAIALQKNEMIEQVQEQLKSKMDIE